MKYFLDTEFLEGPQKEKFPISLFRKQTLNTIDLISIGIVAEDGREYYTISKDFNIKEAWNRFQLEQQSGDMRNQFPEGKKVYWIRENVLRPIYSELNTKEWNAYQKAKRLGIYTKTPVFKFTYKEFKRLIKKYGKNNKQIKTEILQFTLDPNEELYNEWLGTSDEYFEILLNEEGTKAEFYAYYANYDWVVFCWLFGNMMNLPKRFPMYCNDLKQILDEKYPEPKLTELKCNPFVGFPENKNTHNALDDARWNKKLYDFLNKI